MIRFVLFILVICTCCKSRNTDVPYAALPATLTIPTGDSVLGDSIVYHPVRVDGSGRILPWPSPSPAKSYDYVLRLVWEFWKNMEIDANGVPYYMNHQVWDPSHDKRGLGGDQLMMALSSWDLYYNYTGDSTVIGNMRLMADYYLEHGLSSTTDAWPNLPFPYNTNVESGVYDGDMILGKGYLQPDKAGSFGYELVHLFKKTGEDKYLLAAIAIANTLASHVNTGDDDHSPWPFKVNATTGETGILVDNVVWYEGMDKDILSKDVPRQESSYTTFWTGTLNLFDELIDLGRGDTVAYRAAFDLALDWMQSYPAVNNKWGPFFEDVPRWSDTQINAITYAQFLLEHHELDINWKQTVEHIIQWVHSELDNKEYTTYGVTPINEQTAYRKPGNSHSSRQAAIELMYWEQTGEDQYVENDIRMLNWATYMVDHDGKNFYPTNAVWLTDGYGDYVRHYLRAMAAAPELAPSDKPHLLRSSSVVTCVVYNDDRVAYNIFDTMSRDVLRLPRRPASVTVDGKLLHTAGDLQATGWVWQPLYDGGILRIDQQYGSHVVIQY